MGPIGLDQIRVTPLARITAEGGDVLHAMKKSDVGWSGFGEAYFSWVLHGAVKAWKCHTRMTMNLIVPVGRVRFVFMDDSNCRVRQEFAGEGHYVRITVPPGIWFGFQGVSISASLILNLASIEHDPTEVQRVSVTEFNFNWNP
jgi:dTDP-4-dehydrorhamnose 3,5-epimerase